MKKAEDTCCVKVGKYMCLYFSESGCDISHFCMFVFTPFHFTRTFLKGLFLIFVYTNNIFLCLKVL